MAPFVREAILFGKLHGLFDVSPDGDFTVSKKEQLATCAQEEVNSIFSCATFVGRWFCDAGPPDQVYLIWGVTP